MVQTLKEITNYVKEAEGPELAELYNKFSANEVEIKENSFSLKLQYHNYINCILQLHL